MKPIIYIFFLVAVGYGCVSPVNLTFDRAATLGKNNVELNASTSNYRRFQDANTSGKNNNYGGRLGYGVTNNVDLKVRYERMIDITTDDHKGYNYISLFPKIGLIENHLSVLVPFNSYFSEAIFNHDSKYTISPEIIGTLTPFEFLDVTGGIKGEYQFPRGNETSNFYYGFKAGAGFSSNMNKWSIRPEVGLMFKSDESTHIWSYGAGLIYYLNCFSKK